MDGGFAVSTQEVTCTSFLVYIYLMIANVFLACLIYQQRFVNFDFDVSGFGFGDPIARYVVLFHVNVGCSSEFLDSRL